MPIYAYKCDSCGHSKDVLQKMSDPLLVDCPACGAPSFKKQLTSAGFQLKGSGWYVTDFRDGKGGADKPKDGDKPSADGAGKADAPASGGADAAAPAKSDASAVAPQTTKAAAPAPAAASSSSSASASPAPAPKAAP